MTRNNLLVIAVFVALSLQVANAGFTINKSIWSMVHRSSAMKTLRQAMVATGLDELLDNNQLKLTCFLPTDKAFDRLVERLDGEVTLPELLADTDMLAQVIQYHCTEAGQLLKSRLEEGQLVMSNDKELASNQVTVVQSDLGFHLRDALGGHASITQYNNIAGAAVVHVIDSVLIPDIFAASASRK